MEMLKKIIVFFLIAVFLVASTTLVNIGITFFIFDVGELKTENPAKSSFMKYRMFDWDAKKLKDKKINQTWVPLAKVSPAAVKAVLIAGNDKFYTTDDFDFAAMQKTFEQDLKTSKDKHGDQVIARQLARNLFLAPVKGPLRTVKEMILVWRLENNLSQRRILELYLNLVEWGDGIFGIEAASRHYYGKSAADLTSLEAARLAVVLPDPLQYKPTDDSPYVEKRAGIVCGVMEKRDIVIDAYEEIMKAPADGPLR
jgi:monofunctional glycosyltransferase